jgi:hypothetical protein
LDDSLHSEAPEIAGGSDHVVIDGPPRVAALLRLVLLAADAVFIPAQASPFQGLASSAILKLVDKARIFRRSHSMSPLSLLHASDNALSAGMRRPVGTSSMRPRKRVRQQKRSRLPPKSKGSRDDNQAVS